MWSDDYDASHGFLSTKGNAAARSLSARVQHNQVVRTKATELLKKIDNADETHYDERSVHAVKIKTETLLAIDFQDWHSHCDLNKEETAVEEVFIVFETTTPEE